MQGMKNNEQLNQDSGGFGVAEKITMIFEFVSSVVPFFVKFRSMIKMLDIK
jgi:hypothetical protein